MPFSIAGLLSSQETNIGPMALAGGSIYRSRDDNSPDMEKGIHQSIYHIFQH